MDIGGKDLLFQYTSATASGVFAYCRRFWYNAVWQDANSETISTKVYLRRSREFFIYKDIETAHSWDNDIPENQHTMIYFILEPHQGTVVIDTSIIPQELEEILAGLTTRLGWERVHAVPF